VGIALQHQHHCTGRIVTDGGGGAAREAPTALSAGPMLVDRARHPM
jgi:hypothetical protein